MFSNYEKINFEEINIIKYTNLYYINNKFIYISQENNSNLEDVNIRNDLNKESKFRPTILKIDNIDSFIKNNNIRIIDNSTLLATHDYHHNVAHALFDVLYPLFLIFLLFNSSHETKKFHIFLNLITNKLKPFKGECSREYNLEIFKKFCKGELFIQSKIKKNYLFKEIICGIGGAGLSFLNKKGIMPGKEIGVLEKFRNRMLNVYNIVYPINNSKLKIGIIKGGRFQNDDINILEKIVLEYNNDKIECILIDYCKIESFEEQLKLISEINIHISHPGTAMFNFVFLNDNSIHINTGCLYSDFPSFLESNICTLSNNILVKYYDIHKYKKILYDPLITIINKSISDINNNNNNNNKLQNNIPNFIKIWQELCNKDKKIDNLLKKFYFENRPVKKGILCTRFPDGIVYEYVGFREKDNLINNKILQDIKKEYNSLI